MRTITGVLTRCEKQGPYFIAAEHYDNDKPGFDFIPLNRHHHYPVTIPFRFWSEARAIAFSERMVKQYGLTTQVWEQQGPRSYRVAWSWAQGKLTRQCKVRW